MVRATSLLNSEPDPLKPANKIHEAVGPEIAAILNKAMAQKAADRYASASEFREAFRRMGRANQTEVDASANVLVSTSADRRILKHHVSSNHAEDGTVVRIAMVESSRRFGPGAITAVLVALLTLGVAVLYGSQRWISSEVPAATSASATVRRQPLVAPRSDRPRQPESVGVTVAKTRSTNNLATVERAAAAERPAAKPVVAEAKSIEAPRSTGSYNVRRRNGRGRVGAPSIRFPNPEFRNSTPEPLPDSRIRTYTSSGAAPRPTVEPRIRRYSASRATPKFFRAPDGTQIVKFSGGLTRIVRPGERTARSEASYR